MKVEKKYLEVFYLALKDSKLKLADARVRDRFLKPLTEALESFYKERTAIYENFCFKTEDGKPDIKDNKYQFDPLKVDEINVELKALHDEEVDLPSDEKVKGILENTDYEPKAGETEIIDILIAKFK